ncbi:MAG: O-antigen ligase family protein [Allomuricauda sp.]
MTKGNFILLKKIKEVNVSLYSLILSMFFLPLNLQLNNIFLVVFLIFFLLEGGVKEKTSTLLSNYTKVIPIILLFFLIVFGYSFSFETQLAFDQIVKSIPLLLVPLVFISDPKTFFENKNKFLYGLVAGCLVAAIISWGWLIYELWLEGNISKVITWKYSKGNLISKLDQHTPYLAMFLFTSIGFIVSRLGSVEQAKTRTILNVITIIQILFLIHLLSRTAILYFFVAAITFLLIKRRIFVLFALLLMSFSFFTVLTLDSNDKGDYFEKLLFREIGLSGADDLDPRFERWEYSWNLFKKSPIIGVGSGNVDAMRMVAYRKGGDLEAYKLKYNAHNQFVEFLSAQGAIGGLLFLFCFGYLMYLTLSTKDYFLLYVVVGIFVCSLTESILRRSWGVVFFSIMASLVVVSDIRSQKNFSKALTKGNK